MLSEVLLWVPGATDPANESDACARLCQSLGASGGALRLRILHPASDAWDFPALYSADRAVLPWPDSPDHAISMAWPVLAPLSAAEAAGCFSTNLLGRVQ